MFNNYALTPENKMEYNEKKNLYEKALLIKQGFTNYQYVVADTKGKIDQENSIDGNFFQTENEYEIEGANPTQIYFTTLTKASFTILNF